MRELSSHIRESQLKELFLIMIYELGLEDCNHIEVQDYSEDECAQLIDLARTVLSIRRTEDEVAGLKSELIRLEEETERERDAANAERELCSQYKEDAKFISSLTGRLVGDDGKAQS